MEKYTIEFIGRYCKKHNILPDTLVEVYEQHLRQPKITDNMIEQAAGHPDVIPAPYIEKFIQGAKWMRKAWQPLHAINDKISLFFASKGVELIAEERQEQIEKHGFSVGDDNEHYEADELIDAALYAITGDIDHYPKTWGSWWRHKMVAKTNSTPHSKIERLKIAGALLAAEIDRLTFINSDI